MNDSYEAEMNLRMAALLYADAHNALMKDKKGNDPKMLDICYQAANNLKMTAQEFCRASSHSDAKGR